MNRILPTLLALTIVWAMAPATGRAGSEPVAGQDSVTHPVVMQQAANEVATAKVGPQQPFRAAPKSVAVGGAVGLRREVFGFALASSLSDPNIGYPSWNFSLLSTVAFFGLHVNDDGTFTSDSGLTVWNSAQLSNLVATAHASATKVVLTIILQDFCVNKPANGCPAGNPTPHMCAGLANRATTVTNTLAEVTAKGVDGVNIDYEGLSNTCASGQSPRSMMTDLAAKLRGALPGGSYLSVDTYASSAGDGAGFFDVPGLGPSVDSFFVMAYDMEYSNWSHSPPGCASFCLGPTSPLTTYFYNDTNVAAQYVGAVGSAKVILGLPYYGRKACVTPAAPNQVPAGPVTADGYLMATEEASAAGVQPGSYTTQRDANDPSGQERWDTWFNTTLNCTRELYWDDTTSLGLKYDLVNSDGLRGVGIWNLNFGGGAGELWNLLAVKFGTTTPWHSLGGVLTGGAGTSSWGPNRSDVFVLGGGGAVYHRYWTGSYWAGWESAGGVGTADPAAVSGGDGRIDLFVRGGDNALYHKVWLGGGWSAWEGLGGVLSSGPAVASWGPNRLDVFAKGGDNQLYHKVWYGGGGWSPWEGLSGVITSDPTATSWAPGRLDVFARGGDNALYHKAWYGGGWTPWEGLGGALTSSPDATSCATGHLDVFAVGGDSSLYQLSYAGGWKRWSRLGGTWNADPGSVCRPGTYSIDVFERGPDQALWRTSITGT